MSMLPSNLARVPTFLASRIALSSLGRTNSALLNAQNSLSTGRNITRASDDPVRASSILSINERAHLTTLHRQNLQFAHSMMGLLDSSDGPLGDTYNLINEATALASSQVGVGSDPAQRATMAETVDSLLRRLTSNVNYSSQGLYLFGGSTPTTPPVTLVNGAFRYTARGSGLLTDLGVADEIPLTLGGNNAIGEVSARQQSTTDLSPSLTPTTRLADMRGGRGMGVSTGAVSFSFNGGPVASVDLSGAATVQDVDARLTAAINQYQTDNAVTILEPGGITVSGESLAFNIVAGGTLTFTDAPTSHVGADLGLTQAAFTPGTPNGAALDPRLTLATPISALSGVTLPLDSIRIRSRATNGTGTSADIDLSAVNTIDDLRNAIEVGFPGVRVELNAAGTGINIASELAGRAISIEDIAGGANTATQLGIRTFGADTPISTLNYGRGVAIVDGMTDTTGVYARRLNTDFRVTLNNGQYFDVDLRPQDMTDASTLIARINAEFTSQIGTQNNTSAPALAAGDFDARISAGSNGFALFSPIAGTIKVETLNNSAAAEQLGLQNLTLDAGTGEYIAQDRAGIRVDNIFTHLIELRDALYANNSSGIILAENDLKSALDRVITAQAVVGSYDSRLTEHLQRLEDNDLLDKTLLSNLQDTDFADASVQLSNLSTQLQATLQSIGASQGRTLFDFLR